MPHSQQTHEYVHLPPLPKCMNYCVLTPLISLSSEWKMSRSIFCLFAPFCMFHVTRVLVTACGRVLLQYCLWIYIRFSVVVHSVHHFEKREEKNEESFLSSSTIICAAIKCVSSNECKHSEPLESCCIFICVFAMMRTWASYILRLNRIRNRCRHLGEKKISSHRTMANSPNARQSEDEAESWKDEKSTITSISWY